jgi:hypothetical protein
MSAFLYAHGPDEHTQCHAHRVTRCCLTPGCRSQSQLLDKLEAAQDMAKWLDTAPLGLDLEYCMSRSTARSSRLRALGATRLAILLEDDCTMVFSENTCLALVLEHLRSHPSISAADNKALMEMVRWRWLSSSFICSLAGSANIGGSLQAQLREMAMFEPGARAVFLQGNPGHPHIFPNVSKGPRPKSSVSNLEFEWEVGCDALRRSFGTDTRDIIAEPQMHVLAGLSWGAQLYWRRSTAEPGTWLLRLEVVAGTAAGAKLPLGCVVGGDFEAMLDGEPLSCRSEGCCCWKVGSSCYYLAESVLGEILKGWPNPSEADSCLPLKRIQDGKLRGTVTVHDVM